MVKEKQYPIFVPLSNRLQMLALSNLLLPIEVNQSHQKLDLYEETGMRDGDYE